MEQKSAVRPEHKKRTRRCVKVTHVKLSLELVVNLGRQAKYVNFVFACYTNAGGVFS